MILPGMGIISEVIASFFKKRVFGYTAVAFSSVSIAVFSFFAWAHHMFIMGISNYSALVFSLMSMLGAVPPAIKVFNWASTMYKGSITFDTPMLYVLGFIGLFTMGIRPAAFITSLNMVVEVTGMYYIAGANPLRAPDWSGRSNPPLTIQENNFSTRLVTEESLRMTSAIVLK